MLRSFQGLPYHKDGIVTGYLDGHVKFIKCDFTGNTSASLQGRFPWERYGIADDQRYPVGANPWYGQ